MSTVVEFVGLPGAGKSTLLRAVLDDLSEAGTPVMLAADVRAAAVARGNALIGLPATHQIGHLVVKAWCTARDAGLAVSVARVLLRSPRGRADAWQGLRLVLASAQTYRLARAAPRGTVCLIEEGLLQRTFLLFVEADGVAVGSVAERFLRRRPRADVVVWLDAAPSVVVDRVERRPRGIPHRLATLDRATLLRRLAEARSLLEDAVALVVRSGAVVVRLDGARPTNELVGDVTTAVRARPT